MMGLVTDRRFLIGVAVGFFGVPYAMKAVRALTTSLRSSSTAQA